MSESRYGAGLIELTRRFVQCRLVPWPEFRAALIVGSVAHGEARLGSDVDCLFVFDRVEPRIVPAEFVWCPGDDTIHTIFAPEAEEVGSVQIDAGDRRVSFTQLAEGEWEEGLKHDLTHSTVLFDRDGKISSLLSERLRYPEELCTTRVRTHYLRAEYHLKVWRLRAWITRGGLACAHDQLAAAFEELLQLLHAYHREWLPWRYRWLISALKLPWLPEGFAERVERFLGDGALTEESLLRRREVLAQLLHDVGKRLRRDALLDDAADAFAASHPELGYAHNMEAWKSAHQALVRQRRAGTA